ncbi:hypothetical protein AB6O49_33150 [Streptomyces sp. SBR177]
MVPVRDGVAFRLDTAAGLALRGPRRAGAVLDREDVMAGVCCAALPVRAPDGRTVAAVAGMVRAGRALEPLADAVAEAAGALARGLARGCPRRLPPRCSVQRNARRAAPGGPAQWSTCRGKTARHRTRRDGGDVIRTSPEVTSRPWGTPP